MSRLQRQKNRKFFSSQDRWALVLKICEVLSFGFAGVALAGTLAFASQKITRHAFEGDLSLLATSSIEAPREERPLLSPVSTLASKGALLAPSSRFSAVSLVPIAQEVRSHLKGDLIIAKKKDDSPQTKTSSFASLVPSISDLEKSFKMGQVSKNDGYGQKKQIFSEKECLATAIYYEAGSESDLGKMAVGHVILNRSKNPAYPQTICGVVYQGVGTGAPCQFSFACEGKRHMAKNHRLWQKSRQIAERVLTEDDSDLEVIATATHFHADYVKPQWANTMKRLIKIGRHIFYSNT